MPAARSAGPTQQVKPGVQASTPTVQDQKGITVGVEVLVAAVVVVAAAEEVVAAAEEVEETALKLNSAWPPTQ